MLEALILQRSLLRDREMKRLRLLVLGLMVGGNAEKAAAVFDLDGPA